MDCPKCLDARVPYDKKMGVYDTREHLLNIRVRRYICYLCGHKEFTKEFMKTTLKGGKK